MYKKNKISIQKLSKGVSECTNWHYFSKISSPALPSFPAALLCVFLQNQKGYFIWTQCLIEIYHGTVYFSVNE